MLEWHFYDKVFRRWVVLCIGDFDTLVEKLKQLEFSEMEYMVPGGGLTLELTFENTNDHSNCYMVWMPAWNSATVVHEISHLVDMTLEHIGIPIDRTNTETSAFYAEYWWNQFNRARKRFPKGLPHTKPYT